MDKTQAYRLIYATIRRVPSGVVVSYGEVARMAGLAGRARQVGRALRESPSGLCLPWHRIVRASGELAFPIGTSQREEQIQRLASEGVHVVSGRVDMRRYGWQWDADRWLWGPDA